VSNVSNYWPVLIRYSVLYGLVIAIPLANLEDPGSAQREDLVSAIREVSSVMKSWSKFEKDHFTRVALHVDWLNRKLQHADRGEIETPFNILGVPIAPSHDHSRGKRLTFAVKSRMATSMMYDVVWTAKYGAKAEEQERKQASTMPANSASFPIIGDLQVSSSALDMNGLPLPVDDFAFTDGWNDSGFLDIFADWQGLIGIV